MALPIVQTLILEIQKYLSSSEPVALSQVELGASVALHYVSALGPADRKAGT